VSRVDTKFDKELLHVLKERREASSAELINVIVYFEPKIDISELEQLGFNLSYESELLNMVAGQISPDNISEIARMQSVSKLELDSETRHY